MKARCIAAQSRFYLHHSWLRSCERAPCQLCLAFYQTFMHGNTGICQNKNISQKKKAIPEHKNSRRKLVLVLKFLGKWLKTRSTLRYSLMRYLVGGILNGDQLCVR